MKRSRRTQRIRDSYLIQDNTSVFPETPFTFYSQDGPWASSDDERVVVNPEEELPYVTQGK